MWAKGGYEPTMRSRYAASVAERSASNTWLWQDTVPQLDIPLSEVTDVAISSDHTLVIVKVRDGTQFVFKFAVPERAKDWAKYVATRSQKKKK